MKRYLPQYREIPNGQFVPVSRGFAALRLVQSRGPNVTVRKTAQGARYEFAAGDALYTYIPVPSR